MVERVITELLSRHCEGSGALRPGQFGAGRKRSVVEAVGTLVSWVEESWERKEITGALCMDIAAAFPSVARSCLIRRLRETHVDEDIVGWAGSFMQERKVCMVIDGREEREVEVGIGLPHGQGSSVSPILFIIYVSGVHQAGERTGSVRSLSFVDDITWIAHGRSVAEVRVKLEGAARRAIEWGHANGVRLETAKAEAIFSSRNRRHWRERAEGHVMVESRPVPFNRGATRWLGIYLDSRLRFAEHASRSVRQARTAERRLQSIVTRHGVPPISARHLQEAIVGSTFMYGSEVTWRGQRGMESSFQRSINRMARSLGVLPSTPVAFLQAEGGSLPAQARLQKRQSAFAIRLASAQEGSHRGIICGKTGLGKRLQESLGSGVKAREVEKVVPSGGRVFPGGVLVPEDIPKGGSRVTPQSIW